VKTPARQVLTTQPLRQVLKYLIGEDPFLTGSDVRTVIAGFIISDILRPAVTVLTFYNI
jgi:hypothetical protein